MTEHCQRLRDVAASCAVPHILDLPQMRTHREELTLLLVGSAATGLCRPDSDIDIAILCGEMVYQQVRDPRWEASRPCETHVDGVQLHYYGVSFEQVERKMRDLDDVYLYVYSHALVLHDPAGAYGRRIGPLAHGSPEVRR